MKKSLKIVLIIIDVVVFLGIIGLVTWELTTLGPANDALAAMESNAYVTVQDKRSFIVFTPPR
jgi:flagellar basal body-associated protein FliL